VKAYFAAAPDQRASMAFDPKLDQHVLSHSAAVRQMAWEAYGTGHEAQALAAEMKQNRAKFQHHVSPYVWRHVGQKPASGWGLVIAMHGGGKGPKELNDDQWQQMQHYYRDQAGSGGYIYLAIRAPNDGSSGFYEDYNLTLTDLVIRQFLAHGHVDPNKVFVIGYSHGGYGAFFIGPQMADRFAAVHASAAAPATGNEIARNLRNTRFTFMIGQHDTMYGRLNRCLEFNKYIEELQAKNPGSYPVSIQYVPGAHHSDLPDRDRLRDLLSAVRQPLPKEVTWRRMFDVVQSFAWLHLPKPGQADIDAKCRDNQLRITAPNVEVLHVYLDERLADYSQPLDVTLNGRKLSGPIKPSLRTLCETLAERGDRELMFATRIVLKPQPAESAMK
jgi:hypothetical protein